MPPELSELKTCRCGAQLGADSLRLWDGHTYCFACVNGSSSILADYAQTHGRLEEIGTLDAACCRRYLTRLGIFGLVFSVFLTLGGVATDPRHWLGYLAFMIVLTGIIFPLFVLDQLWRARKSMATVEVRDGELQWSRVGVLQTKVGLLQWSRLLEFRETTVPLSLVRWDVGKAGQDRFTTSTIVAGQIVILLYFPSRRKGGRNKCVACGWTPEFLEIWEGFLTLAGVPRLEDPALWASRLDAVEQSH